MARSACDRPLGMEATLARCDNPRFACRCPRDREANVRCSPVDALGSPVIGTPCVQLACCHRPTCTGFASGAQARCLNNVRERVDLIASSPTMQSHNPLVHCVGVGSRVPPRMLLTVAFSVPVILAALRTRLLQKWFARRHRVAPVWRALYSSAGTIKRPAES